MERKLALITGASSGIGAAYVRLLASDHDFVLVARRVERLSELADEVRTAGAAVEVLPADLATREGLDAVTKRLAAGDVRLLISNAGVGGYAPLAQVGSAEVGRLVTLNSSATIELVHAALPGMLAAGDGSIVTVASLLAFSAGVVNPHMPPRTLYVAAKASTVAFTRALALELGNTGVHAQVVCPGIVDTEFNGDYARDVPYAMTPEGVAQASLAGLKLGETVCVPGLEDLPSALDDLLTAETALLEGSAPTPASRYSQL